MINRWIDDLGAPDGGMNGSLPLPNQKENRESKFGPWLHRFLVLITIIMAIFFQEQIIELLGLVNIENNFILVNVQLIVIIIFWGAFHQFLRLS